MMMEDKPENKKITLEETIEEIRKDFPLLKEKIYFNSCSCGLLNIRVKSAIQEYIELWNRKGSPWDIWLNKIEDLRALFARFIYSEKEEIAISFSASSAINAVASSFNYKSRNEIILSDLEFPTVIYIWLAQKNRGAIIKRIYSKEYKIEPEQFYNKISNNTLIIPLTYLCYKNGYKLEIEEITEYAHKNGALTFIDGYQILGTEDINVKKLDVDFFVSGSLKYLLGSSGIAFLYVKKELIEKLKPIYTGWFAQKKPFAFDTENFEYAPSAKRFESGTPSFSSVYTTFEGIKIIQEIGIENISNRIKALSSYLIEGLQNLNLKVYTPENPKRRGPLVVFEAKSPEKTVKMLEENNIITSFRGKGVRVSLHFYNTIDEIDILLRTLKKNISCII
ncbi:hypothetical protein DRQ09_01625 [candidate division KSB1 bacterium]|nr:MAG: hypothetical protein DRQ09_01625 [candidate division KSB1 bacterium]